MKQLIYLSIITAVLFASCNTGSQKGKTAETFQPIETNVSARPAGQKHVVGLTSPKMDTVRVGFIGLGMRGPGAVQRFTHIPGAKIVALCDLHPDRV